LYGHRELNAQLNAAEEAAFQAATECHICNQPFTANLDLNGGEIKVRDHQHSAPYQYRGAAHRHCNLQFKEQTVVNCYFHNLSNYDAHFIVRELNVDAGDVRVLANTDEKYITFSKRFIYPGAGRQDGIVVRFIDSYRFLTRALSTLVDILPVDKLQCTREHFGAVPQQFEMAKRKGVFPYEYVTSLIVLDEQELPPPLAFRDSLRKTDVSEDDYAYAQRVWDEFGCRTLGDYADIYLKTDVLLLADVFETFRDNCLEHYGLDPSHYLTLPSYTWDCMLLHTKVKLDTLQDVDQYLFFEKGIRGGLTQCVTRHVLADNKYTRQQPNVSQHDNYIMYYDANNLYGWAMSQPLPTGNFQWLSRQEIDTLTIEEIAVDNNVGYVLEVDIEYPKDRDLQDRQRDLPFCPELCKAPRDQLPYSPEVLRT